MATQPKTVYGDPIVKPAQQQRVELEILDESKLDIRIQKRLPIWIINTAVPSATLGLSFTDLNGNRKKAYQIPKSKLPFCITNDIGHNMLRDGGTDLRNMLSRKWVRLVTAKSAKAFLATEEAKYEIDRLKRNKMMGTFTGDNIEDYNLQPFMDAQRNTDLQDIAAGTKDFSIKPEFVKAQIKDLVVRVEENTTPVRDAMAELEIMGSQLSVDDLHYLMASTEGRLKQYASRKLEAQGGSGDDEVQVKAGGYDINDVQTAPIGSKTVAEDGYDMFDDDGKETPEERTQRMRQQARSADAAEAAERDFQAQRESITPGTRR